MFQSALALGFLIFSSQTLVATARPLKSDAEYWRATGINFDIVVQNYQRFCARDEVMFNACLISLNQLASSLGDPLRLATSEEASAFPEFFGSYTGTSYGRLRLYASKSPDEQGNSRRQKWETYSKFRYYETQFAKGLFSEGAASSIKYDLIVNDLKAKLLVGAARDDEAYYASETLNALVGASTDPHSRYMPTQQLKDQQAATAAVYFGIGIGMVAEGSNVVVKKLIPGGPAYRAGLHEGDIIVRVGEKVLSSNLLKVREVLESQKSQPSLKIAVKRKLKYPSTSNDMEQLLSFDVKQEELVQPNVVQNTLSLHGKLFGVIKMGDFLSSNGCSEVKSSLVSLIGEGVDGIILDLRDNPGGDVEQAVCVAALFVGKKLIVTGIPLTENNNPFSSGKMEKFGQSESLTDLPLITLIDAGSASASEIVSGALQDYQRSWIGGQTSFGKATVQAGGILDVNPDIVFFKTIMRFHEPSGRTNQIVGIQPDFFIDPVPNASDDDRFALREGDAYSNPLQAKGKPWVQPRPKDVARISACVQRDLEPEQIYNASEASQVRADYQVLKAMAILTCDR